LRRESAIARDSGVPVARDGLQRPVGLYPANALVPIVREYHVSLRIDRHGERRTKLRVRRQRAVRRESLMPVARHGRDHSVCSDLADTLIAAICDIQIALGIDRDICREAQSRRRSQPPIANGCAFSHHGVYVAAIRESANAPVVAIGDENISLRIDRHGDRR